LATVLSLKEKKMKNLFLKRRDLLLSAGAGLLAFCGAPSAFAQSFPAKPIVLIAPYPAGGGVDTVARLLAERLSVKLNQPVTVDNRPGAGSTIGGAGLARSAPDGYTLMLGSMVDYAIAPHAYKSLSFDPQKDFVAISEVGYGTVALIVNADLPVKSIKELVALAKSKPGTLSYASSGMGGLQHLNAEMFKQMTGIDMVHVPYKGTAQFMPDLIAGRIPLSIDSLPAHLQNIRAGKTRALAVANATRSSTLPDVPTFIEAGVAGYESSTNYTLYAPAKTPQDIVAMLNKEINAIIQEPAFIEKFSTLGISTRGGSVDSAKLRAGNEVTKWANVIRNGNIVLN
jgi:tripartite-type tricarboxylate transporter receptor subunit TctC